MSSKSKLIFIILSSISNFYLFCECNVLKEPLVLTKSGPVSGKTDININGKAVDIFLGIPYASPPVGPLRFKHPRPVQPWTDTLNATTFSDSCIQKMNKRFQNTKGFNRFVPSNKLNEDCLYLNIWAPKRFYQDPGWPVIFSVHGGGYSLGSGSAELSNPATLAFEEDVIVVNLNYRLGVLGFLYLEKPEVEANAGLMDIVMALHWVKDNIEAFGGDPNRITLQGQNAGAFAVGGLILSPLAAGIAQGAILQSGAPSSPFAVDENRIALEKSHKLVEYVGCDKLLNGRRVADIDCLRTIESMELISNEPILDSDPFVFRPVVDGLFFTDHPSETLRKKNHARINLMVGGVKDEGTFLLSSSDESVYLLIRDHINPIHSDFLKVIKHGFVRDSELVRQAIELQYTEFLDPDNHKGVVNSGSNLIADYYFNCPANLLTRSFSAFGSDVYAYEFDYRSPSSDLPKWLGVSHMSDIEFFFGHLLNNGTKRTTAERKFSSRLMRYWANFARTGNPNMSPSGVVESITWPRYTAVDRQYLVLAPESSELRNKHKENECFFWDETIKILRKSRIQQLNGKMDY